VKPLGCDKCFVSASAAAHTWPGYERSHGPLQDQFGDSSSSTIFTVDCVSGAAQDHTLVRKAGATATTSDVEWATGRNTQWSVLPKDSYLATNGNIYSVPTGRTSPCTCICNAGRILACMVSDIQLVPCECLKRSQRMLLLQVPTLLPALVMHVPDFIPESH
jgi:hypothetical protein